MNDVEAVSQRPTYFQSMFFRWFGPLAVRRMQHHPDLGTKLLKARRALMPEAYLSMAYGHAAIAFVAGWIPFLAAMALGIGDGRLFIALAMLPFVLAVTVYSVDFLRPDMEMGARRKDIEQNLPYALNFLAALASAGVVPMECFGRLGRQPVYGEVSREAQWIFRDARLFNMDILQALRVAARRTPSPQFEEFLQGCINTVTSGGDLKLYFLGKATQYAQDMRRKQKGFLESMGVMAESYVVVAAASPLFLIVILSVMTLLGGGGNASFFLNMVVLLALPVLHGMFTWVLRSMKPE